MSKLIVSLFLFSVFSSINIFGSDYYWIGGSGDWSDINHWATTSGGSVNHIQTPTSNDNVIFDDNSFNSTSSVNLNLATIFCKSFNADQINQNVTLNGICTLWKVYGGFTLSKKISISNLDIYFEAQSGTFDLKFKNLNLFNNIFFKGSATWVLQDSLNCRNIELESGKFTAISKSINASDFKSNAVVTRELDISNSNLKVVNWEVNGAGYIVSANNSIIKVLGSKFRHVSNGNLAYHDLYLLNFCSLSNSQQNITFRKVQFYQNGNISGTNTYDSLIFTMGKDYLLAANTTQYIIKDLVAIGDCKRKIKIEASSSFAAFSKSSGNIYCSYLILKHIHAIGGANFQSSATEDLGDNVGWILTPPPPRTLYWVGSTGNWSDTIHWSYTSGGPGGECIPTIVDDVVIDTNSYSFIWTLSVNQPAICHDFTWNSSALGMLESPNKLEISGSMFLGENLEMKPTADIRFVSNNNGETITTSNINLNNANIMFTGRGSWTLQDSINNSGGTFNLIRGHLLTNGQYLLNNAFGATSDGFKKLSMSNSIIDCENLARFQQDSLIIYPGTSHIRMIGAETTFETVGPNPDSLYNLSFVSDTGTASYDVDKSTFNKIAHYCDTKLSGFATSDTLFFAKGRSFVFSSRTDTIKKALIANGNCNDVITFREYSAMGQFKFIMPATASVNVNNTSMRGCKGLGGANFIAYNSSDLSNNEGWTFTNIAANHYWISGTGNWQDSAHWSYSSGGQGGACIPRIFDNVYFDASSFSSTNDTVIVDSNNIFCQDMNWLAATGEPVFLFDTSDYVHFISGSMSLIQNMDFVNRNKTFFVWDQLNKTIDMASQIFQEDIIFADSGQWTLLDTLTVESNIYHNMGFLLTNEKPVFAHSYFGEYDDTKALDIHNNTFTITGANAGSMFSWVKSANTSFNANNSEIIFEKGGVLKSSGLGQLLFNNVSFIDSLTLGIIRHNTAITDLFNKMYFKGDGRVEAENHFDTLIFTKSRTYQLEGGMNQYITHLWQANADCYGFINIKGEYLSVSSSSNIANVNMLNGNVSLSGVKLANVNGIGNGSFNIVNGMDLGGNSPNWQITTYPARTLYWVNNTGSWWDTAHWSLSSGGISGECIPTYIDDVHFTQESFTAASDTAFSLNVPIECHNMYWNYTPDNPFMDIRYLNIYGSLWLGDTMTINSATELSLFAVDSSNIIRSASKSFVSTYFKKQGEWNLVDYFASNIIYHDEGVFNLNGNTVLTEEYRSLNSSANPPHRELNMSNAKLMVGSKIDIKTDNYNIIAVNSDILFDSPLSLNPIFKFELEGNNILNFGRVTFKPSMTGKSIITNFSPSVHNFEKVTINNSADIFGEHYFDSLVFHAGNTYQLEKGKTQYIGDYWFVRGNNCFALILQSTQKGFQAYTSKFSGNVNGDFINMRDIHAIGGANFFAGDFSTDISNNSAWTFSNGPQYVYGLGPNLSLNLGSSIILSSANFNGGPNTSYQWSTGSTNPDITVNQTGWYYITVNYAGGCIVYDSIWVGCNLNMNYNITDNPCYGDSAGVIISIEPDSNYVYEYQWSNNAITANVNGLSAGIYTVTISADSGFCVLYDTLQISQPNEIFSSQDDTAFCLGDSVRLDLGNFISFNWDDGYNNQFRWVSQRDSFVVKVEDNNGCWSFPDTINVRQDLPPLITLADDTTICIGGYVNLDAGTGYDAYLWSNNSALSAITIYNTGVYWVAVSEKTCVSFDTVVVFNCPPKFVIPNVFTPNGDGYNDILEIEYQNIWQFEIKIYNRWGSRVFYTNNLDNPWDGKINGQDAIEGVYFWEIIYQEYNGQGGGSNNKYIKGTVSLFRH